MRKTWTDNEFIWAVKNSKTIKETIRKLGLNNFGANYNTVKRNVKRLNLNTDHFISKSDQLKEARSNRVILSDEDLFSVNDVARGHIKYRIISKKLIEYKC